MNGPIQAKLLLTTLSIRTSAKGTSYLAGWLGKAQLVAFAGEPDKFGNATWDVFVSKPADREEGQGTARSSGR